MPSTILYCNGSLQHSLWTDTFSFLLGIRSRKEASHHIVLRECGFINKSARLLANRIYLNITKRYKNWGKTLVPGSLLELFILEHTSDVTQIVNNWGDIIYQSPDNQVCNAFTLCSYDEVWWLYAQYVYFTLVWHSVIRKWHNASRRA